MVLAEIFTRLCRETILVPPFCLQQTPKVAVNFVVAFLLLERNDSTPRKTICIMSDNMDELVRKAAVIMASVVFGSLKLKAAMIIVGFCADDAKAAKFQMRVRRYLQNNHQGSASIPSLIQCKSVNEVSTLVSQNIMLPSGVTQKPPPPAVSSIKRKISYMYDSDNDDKPSDLSRVSTDTSSMSELAAIKQKLEDLEGTKLNPKRTRRTSAQKQN